jgi:hypothetical protein
LYLTNVNRWHSLTKLTSFVNWNKENECTVPEIFLLYPCGQIVKKMGSWISHTVHVSLGCSVEIDFLEYGDGFVYFERAVVYHEDLGPISSENKTMLFDMISCKAWKLCNVFARKHFINKICIVNLMLFASTRSKSFKNKSNVEMYTTFKNETIVLI